MGIINQFHPHNPEEDVVDICEWIDAGIFSGDLLYCCDLEKFENYVDRWKRAITDQKKMEEDDANNI